MPKEGRKNLRQRLRSFWHEWRMVVLLGVLIVGGAAFYRFVLQPRPRRLSAAAPYAVYFTQGDAGQPTSRGIPAEIARDIAAAQKRILLAAPGLDVEEIASALLDARARGVEVRILEDPLRQEDPQVAATAARLEQGGIPVAWHPSPGGLGESFLVIDDRLLWAGSAEFSRAGLAQDAAYILRWPIPALAEAFGREFDEMFVEHAFGRSSPKEAQRVHIALPDRGSITVYFTPEDDPLSAILQSMARVNSQIAFLTERFDDPRLGERMSAEAMRAPVQLWGVYDPGGGIAPQILEALRKGRTMLAAYQGGGRLQENVLTVDEQTVFIFSQPLDAQGLDTRDGFVIALQDWDLGQRFGRELARLYRQTQGSP
ncbi:MAG: phospholipase D-like domain-containing protein [Chloroflexia bacterium]